MKKCSQILFVVILFLVEASMLQAFDIKSMLEGMGTSFGAPPVGYTYSYEVWSDASVPIYVEQEGYASFMGAFFPSAKGYYGKKTLPSIFDAAGSVSSAAYHGQDYYFKMYISANSEAPHAHALYKQSLTQLPLLKGDPKVYYYHVYTSGGFSKGNTVHGPAVETMGFQDPTQLSDPHSTTKGSVVLSSQLSTLAFYNSSGIDVRVDLTYGPDAYTFTLEKYSYNLLAIPTPEEKKSPSAAIDLPIAPVVSSSTPQVSQSADSSQNVVTQAIDDTTTESSPPPLFSLRPNTLTFTSYDSASNKYTTFRTLMLPSTGFDGSTYTIEVFQDPGKNLEVGIQGLNPGNYDVAVTPRVRDLTPCPCTFWHQSFEQGGSIEGYGNLPGQVWVVYGGADNPIQVKVEPGQAIGWNLVRPLLSQGDQFLYFIYVITTDDIVAQKFIAKVLAQSLGKNVIDQYQTMIDMPVPPKSTDSGLDLLNDTNAVAAPQASIDAAQEVAAVMGTLNIANGVIEDKDQGVIGYLLGADIFTPKGLGFGRYYYVLAPSVISVASLVSSVYGCLDSAKTSGIASSDADIQKAMTTMVNGWLAAYIKNPADVEEQVKQYLIEYGNAKVVDAKTGTLTKYGQILLQSILSGTVSLKYPSMKLSTVTNQFVYDFGKSAPEKMPDPIMQKPQAK